MKLREYIWFIVMFGMIALVGAGVGSSIVFGLGIAGIFGTLILRGTK